MLQVNYYYASNGPINKLLLQTTLLSNTHKAHLFTYSNQIITYTHLF